MKNLKTVILTLILLAVSGGCSDIVSGLNLDSFEHRRTKQRAAFVAETVEGEFPNGLVVYFKKENKYFALETFKESNSCFDMFYRARTLRIGVYEPEHRINGMEKYIIPNKGDEDAIFYSIDVVNILNSSCCSREVFKDKNANGMERNSGDVFERIINGKKEISTEGYDFRRAKDSYAECLRYLESY
jgi:hypothetical protein